MLQRLADAGLVKGKTIGIDATTLEANAALRSIVRRDTGESYQDFLTQAGAGLGHRDADARGPGADRSEAEEEGLERRLDASARSRREDHQDEGRAHALGPQSRACRRSRRPARSSAVTVQDADEGDTTTSVETLIEAAEQVEAVRPDGDGHRGGRRRQGLSQQSGRWSISKRVGVRSYISEPDRGRRKWKKNAEARDAVYRNRRRIRGARGKRLLRLRGERLERPLRPSLRDRRDAPRAPARPHEHSESGC